MASDNTGQQVLAAYDGHVREIYAFCLRRLACAHLAEDAASAVFLRLVRQYGQVKDRDASGLRNWLYGTASNIVAECLRDARRRREAQAELAKWKRQTDLPAGTDRLDWPVLYEAIGKLKPRHQDIVVLRYFQGLETSEIAAALGMREPAVRKCLSRAMRRLRGRLGDAFGH